MKAVVIEKKLYTIDEVAELLGVCPRSVRNYTTRGELTPTNIGKKVFYTEENLRNFLKFDLEREEPQKPPRAPLFAKK